MIDIDAIRDIRTPTTLSQEMKINPFLSADKDTFIKLRSMRDNF
jgi:Hydroxyacylglutathione hydrolase C-terminus